MIQPSPSPSTDAQKHRQRMQKRAELKARQTSDMITEKGLVIVHTGMGKGKTTAAFGMVVRSLGHGCRVAVVQFIKGCLETAEQRALAAWKDQLQFHVAGEGFTWETQDRDRDERMAQEGWKLALRYLQDPAYRLVLLDEVNVALSHSYLSLEQVLAGLDGKPASTHVVLTGRAAPAALVERADLVTEMKLIKHPFKQQRVLGQPGVEF